MFNERQTGRTTDQLRAAPRDAVFICPTDRAITYTRHLAGDIGRTDLRFHSPQFFDREAWRGLRVAVILDHATWGFMNDRQKTACVQMDDYLAAVLS